MLVSINQINSAAPVICCNYANVPVCDLLNIRAFDPSKNDALNNINEYDNSNVSTMGFIQYDDDGKILPQRIRLHRKNKTENNSVFKVDTVNNSDENTSKNNESNEINTVSLSSYNPIDLDMFNLWISSLLRLQGGNIYRLKGIINMYGYDSQFVVQGIHMIFDGQLGPNWDDDNSNNNDSETQSYSATIDNSTTTQDYSSSARMNNNSKRRKSRLVFIGMGLNATVLKQNFLACENNEISDDNH